MLDYPKRVCPETHDPWELVCFVAHYAYSTDLPTPAQDELNKVVWELQDGFGEAGFTPPQGWDWSGIRDSSHQTQAKMADAIRATLRNHNIHSFTVTKRTF